MNFKKTLFIFRKDLRLDDNTGINFALRNSQETIGCFIFDKKQIDKDKNPYFSDNLVQFMIESLKDLDSQLRYHNSRLFYFYGEYPNVINNIFSEIKPDLVCFNNDYTPYSRERDERIMKEAEKRKISFKSFDDASLCDHEEVLSNCKSGTFYKVFTPFYRTAASLKKKPLTSMPNSNFISFKSIFKCEFSENIDDFYDHNEHIEIKGGRSEGLKIIENIDKHRHYAHERNYPILNTTKLSAFLRFGVISMRETYQAIKNMIGASGEELIRQLYWRDFYNFIIYYYPHVANGPMRKEYAEIKWDYNENYLNKWKIGMTGCPIVDAGMRCLNKTGFMHNRLRMITANFLIKDLHIDWREGEKYFATKLVDYDIAQNSGGWQWCAGCGVDSQPYFRIFNPKLQSEKFDADAEFIKKWIPELKGVPSSKIHNWEESYKAFPDVKYPSPIIIHSKEKDKCLSLYKEALNKGKAEESPEKINLKKVKLENKKK